MSRIINEKSDSIATVTKLGDPLPRPLPDGRVIADEKLVEGLTDLEAMAWLDGYEKYLAGVEE